VYFKVLFGNVLFSFSISSEQREAVDWVSSAL